MYRDVNTGYSEHLYKSGNYRLLKNVSKAINVQIIPSKTRPGEALLEWEVALRDIPWGLIMLLGGGIAVAGAPTLPSFFCHAIRVHARFWTGPCN